MTRAELDAVRLVTVLSQLPRGQQGGTGPSQLDFLDFIASARISVL